MQLTHRPSWLVRVAIINLDKQQQDEIMFSLSLRGGVCIKRPSRTRSLRCCPRPRRLCTLRPQRTCSRLFRSHTSTCRVRKTIFIAFQQYQLPLMLAQMELDNEADNLENARGPEEVLATMLKPPDQIFLSKPRDFLEAMQIMLNEAKKSLANGNAG